MRIKTIYKNASIIVDTIKNLTPGKKIDLVVTEKEETPDKTLTIIEINIENKIITIACYWSQFSESLNFSHYWSEEERILFIGAGHVSAVLNPLTLEILVINYPDLFWDWQYIKGYILELGELQCRLYRPTGEFVAETAVDPPYEYSVTENTIEFSSMIAGTTKIEFVNS